MGFIVGLDRARGFGGQGQEAEQFDGDWLGASSLGSDGAERELVSAFGQFVRAKLQIHLVVLGSAEGGPLEDHLAVQLDVAGAKIRGGASGQSHRVTALSLDLKGHRESLPHGSISPA